MAEKPLRFWSCLLQQPTLVILTHISNNTSLKTEAPRAMARVPAISCQIQGSFAHGTLRLALVQAVVLCGAQGESLPLSGPQFSHLQKESFVLDGGVGHFVGKSYCCLQPKYIIPP